eukprot:6717571-Lingulodinium_polyedra.AAC.1
MERCVSDLDESEAQQVPRVCKEIQERVEDEWINAKTGRPCTTDKPCAGWTPVDDETDHPRPPEGAADGDTEVRITSKHAQFL